MGCREFYRRQKCGSKNEAAQVSCYLRAGIEWIISKGIDQRKSLETSVSKRVFRVFLRAQKDTAATRSGIFLHFMQTKSVGQARRFFVTF